MHEIVVTFGTSARRKDILLGLLNFRSNLRAANFPGGFQWIDGSFVEQKDPNDIDVMTFLYKPVELQDRNKIPAWLSAHRHLLDRAKVKFMFNVDSMLLDLNGSPEALVDSTRYYGSLFSHRRTDGSRPGDNIWKGMLAVRLEDVADDQAALAALMSPPVVAVPGVGP